MCIVRNKTTKRRREALFTKRPSYKKNILKKYISKFYTKARKIIIGGKLFQVRCKNSNKIGTLTERKIDNKTKPEDSSQFKAYNIRALYIETKKNLKSLSNELCKNHETF
jgi:hypothetical protein